MQFFNPVPTKHEKGNMKFLIDTNKPITSLRNLNIPQTFLTKTPFLLSLPCQLMECHPLFCFPHPQPIASPNFINSTLKMHLQFHHFFPLSSAAALVHATICPPHDGFTFLQLMLLPHGSRQNDPLSLSIWESDYGILSSNPATNPPLISTEWQWPSWTVTSIVWHP